MINRDGLSSFLLALVTTIALLALTGFQVSSETAGTRLLGRLGAALIEIDLWLPVHQDELQLLARDKPGGELQVGDLPFTVAIPSVLVIEADEMALRSMISEAAGATLYRNGLDGFMSGENTGGSLGFNEPVRWLVTLLDSGAHGFWQAALPLIVLLLVALLALALTSGGLPLPALAAGAAGAAGISFLGWVLMELGSSSANSGLDKETFLILRDGFWIGVRNGAAVALAAAALILLMRSLSQAGGRKSGNEAVLESQEEPFL